MSKRLCDICDTEHAEHQAHVFASTVVNKKVNDVNTIVNDVNNNVNAVSTTANDVNTIVNACHGCRERDVVIAALEALIAQRQPSITRKDYMREYMRKRRRG